MQNEEEAKDWPSVLVEAITERQEEARHVQPPSVGRIVHYVLESGRSKGDHRPAIVVRDWSNSGASYPDGTVNMQVFTDGYNDGFETSFAVTDNIKQIGAVKQIDLIIWRTSVHYDENKEPGTWHWPERA